jgi:hypothetical protein
MKTSIKLSFMVMLAIIAITSCKKDTRTLDTTVVAVNTLDAPADHAAVPISISGPSIVFKWEASTSNDLVLYEVAFDKADGDFSNPIYKVISDGKGVQSQATISQSTLNQVAVAAHIPLAGTGSVKWAVITSKVTTNKVSTQSRTLQLTRPPGFVVPDALYLTGTATEQGSDITKALPFKRIIVTNGSSSDTTFELYTSLQAGTYNLIDKNSGSPTSYSITNSSLVVAGGSTTVTGAKNVYRLSVHMGTAGVTITQIVSVGFFNAPDNQVYFTLPYIGNSQWEIDNTAIVIPKESYGLDSRYKYKFVVMDSSGNQSVEWYGSANSDNPDPSTSTPPAYFYMYPVDNSQFNFCFKVVPAYNNKIGSVNVNYSPGLANYTNTITVK